MDEQPTTGQDNSQAPSATPGTTETGTPTPTDSQNATSSANLDTSKPPESAVDGEQAKTDGQESKTPVSFDADLDGWAEKTGRKKPENDVERGYLQEIRNGQREYSRSKQAKDSLKQVDQAITEVTTKAAEQATETKQQPPENVDPLEQEVKDLRTQYESERATRLRSEFFAEQGVTENESKVMGEILQEKVARGGRVAFDYWTNPDNLKDWHDLAKARLMQATDTSVVEQEAVKRERERIAQESQAGSTARNARSTVTNKEPSDDQRRIELWST